MLRPMHKEDFMQVVTTDRQRKIRQADLLRQDQEDLKKSEEARKNKGFTQVYPKGWKRIMELSKRNASASGLYAFFAQHIDSSCGAVVCDQQFLANEFGVNRSTISRWLAFLEKEGAVVRIPVAGRVCAYALDPHEVWKGYNTGKEYAAFMTKTLVNKDGDIQRRIMTMFSPDAHEEQKTELEKLEEQGQQRFNDI